MPLEERKYKDMNQFGEGDQAKVCVDIMHKTGAHLELSMAKDQGLSIMVSGKLDAVMKARKEIVSRLQTQVCFMVKEIALLSNTFVWGFFLSRFDFVVSVLEDPCFGHKQLSLSLQNKFIYLSVNKRVVM